MRRLIIRPGAIGDCIVSLPALECLKTEYTEVWTPSALVSLMRFADRACPIASTGLDLVGVGETYPSLWSRLASFDSIVSWYGANRAEFREAVAAYRFEFHRALPHGEPAADFYLRQVGCAPGAAPRIHCPARGRTFIAVHPFSGSAKKNWPLKAFRQLGRQLERLAPVEWCITDDGEHRIADLYELACWLCGARLYVGNDSGITHLAAAVGTPVVAVFMGSDPFVWAPRGAPCEVLVQPEEEEVYESCVRLLSRSQTLRAGGLFAGDCNAG